MKNKIEKFLEFNGKVINFLAADGVYWIAVKPICEALEIHVQNQNEILHNLQREVDLLYGNHHIVGNVCFTKVISEQLMFTESGKMRKMLCINEIFVYGWLFQIQSPGNTELLKYQLQCYQLLYNYFHGTITARETLLKTKTRAEMEIERLEKELENSETYKKIQQIKKTQKETNLQLRKLDNEIVDTQLEIWSQEFAIIQETPAE